MHIRQTLKSSGNEDNYFIEQMSDDDRISMSHADLTVCDTRYCNTYVRSMNWGGVGTPPEYRRSGLVRQIFDDALYKANEYGAAVSMMHPFSFSFYRKMGYERIADKLQCSFPITALDFVPRYPDLVPYNEKYLSSYLKFFEVFSQNRNAMQRRFDNHWVDPTVEIFARHLCSRLKTYLLIRDGEVKGYVVYDLRKHFDGVNHMVSDGLYVLEFGYADKDALLKVLGFLRMYEGELTDVIFHDLSPIPEVDLILQHYTHTKYQVIPDMAARILNTAEMLKKNVYPQERGAFILRVEDTLPDAAGRFRVEYEKGKANVEKLADEGACDAAFTAPPLARLFYGTHAFTPDLLANTNGVTLYNDANDLIRAFPKRIVGAFEFF